jgi:hypothetical protein
VAKVISVPKSPLITGVVDGGAMLPEGIKSAFEAVH